MNDDEIKFDDLYYRYELKSWYEKVKTRKTFIERIQKNPDDKSWEEFTHFYTDFIYNIIRSMGLSHHDAEDLRQQVLLKAWKGLEKMTYDPAKKPFRTWMSTVVKNTVRTFFNKKSTKKANQESDIDQAYGNAIAVMVEVDEVEEKQWEVHISQLALTEVRKRFSSTVMSVFETFLEGKVVSLSRKSTTSLLTLFFYKRRVQNALYKEIIRLDQELN